MSRTIKKGDYWRNVVYKSKNLIIQKVKEGKDITLIIGNSHSVELNNDDIIVWADPGMHEFRPKITDKDVTVYTFYFVKKIARLDEAGKELAEFMNSMKGEFKKIVLIGHSKSGICIESACDYTKRKVDICIAVSTPHAGTISADGKLFAKKLKNPILGYIYLKAFSDHQVDRDVIPGSPIIENVHRPKVHRHINIVSTLDFKSACKNIIDLGSLILDQITEMNGDGIVSEESQRVSWTDEEILIYCSHARSLNESIKYVDKNILNQ